MGRILVVVCCYVLLAGCGSTKGLRQGAEVSEAGKAYATAMQSVADFALAKRISFLGTQLAQERLEAPGNAKTLKASLASRVELGREYAILIGTFKVQSKLLWDYFDALDKLVKEPVSEPTATAAKEFADGFAAIGKAFGKANIHVSPDQKTALGGLAGSIATAYHGKVVSELLRNDAQMIGEQLELQKLALHQFAGSIVFVAKFEQNDTYNKKVLEPYLAEAGKDPKAALPSDWEPSLAISIRDVASAQEVENAKSTAKKMQSVWKDYLAGTSKSGDLLGEATLLNGALTYAKNAHEARHMPVTQ